MSANHIFDAIEDELIRCLEEDAILPDEFPIHLEPKQLRALMEAKLINPRTKQSLPPETQRVLVRIAGHNVWLTSDEYQSQEIQ
jgi:hypothetical protein